MIDKKQISRDYKQQKQPEAVRRFEFTLQMGGFPYQDLINDYKKLGKDNFEIKILDELEIKNETDKEIDTELNSLEELWIEKLKDEGVRFYNKKA